MSLLQVLRGDPNRHAEAVRQYCRQLRGIRNRLEASDTDHVPMAIAIRGEQASGRRGQRGGRGGGVGRCGSTQHLRGGLCQGVGGEGTLELGRGCARASGQKPRIGRVNRVKGI